MTLSAHDTINSDFWIDTKKSVDVDMMEQTIGPLHYAEIDGVTLLNIDVTAAASVPSSFTFTNAS